MLNFMNKKFYFHSLANVELKLHMKILKNHFHNIASKNFRLWPLYYNHNLAAGKLRTTDSNKT